MAHLEDLTKGAAVRGVVPGAIVTVIEARWHGAAAVELTYKDATGKPGNQLLFRDDEARLELVTSGQPWRFDADGALLRLASEAQRIRWAHLFDPYLAVHTSLIEPLPHQITAVYEKMLPRQPLRFLLADDPGAGKTIMAGLYIKELIIRGDLQRCLVVCPGNLAEQWQDELYRRFHLPFDLLTNDRIESARSGNVFAEIPLLIARLDKLARSEDLQDKLALVDWDLVVCDEAHKMSATFFGGELKYTKRYRLGQRLAQAARHFLLMTATPHNGKEEDFQLFMGLLDADRFEGRFRDGVHEVDVSDLMRRMVKERLLRFDGRPLFPERVAYTVPYRLSDLEARLYRAVTEYVRQEFNRADLLQGDGRKGTIGFALTILQRRLASSPEAIYQSLKRRRERLEARLHQEELLSRGQVEAGPARRAPAPGELVLSEDELEDLEDAPAEELESLEEELIDRATAARTVEELHIEIASLFDKALIHVPGKPQAAFICPGHPLLDATLDLVLERYRDLMKQGAVLVDDKDMGEQMRALLYLEHSIQDARPGGDGGRRLISRRLQFVELPLGEMETHETGFVPAQPGFSSIALGRDAGPAPYLDYRSPDAREQALLQPLVERALSARALEAEAISYAIAHLAPLHLREVREVREPLIDKTIAAVRERLTKEIVYWDHRAAELVAQEQAGKVNAQLNSARARQRADELQERLQKRMAELAQERQISVLPPAAIGGALVVPAGLLARLKGERESAPDLFARETKRVELAGMAAVMTAEAALGHLPRDVSAQNVGYDIESAEPDGSPALVPTGRTGEEDAAGTDGGSRLRFIEVKGRIRGATTVTVTKNEILAALNKPEQWILALVEVPPQEDLPPDVAAGMVREPSVSYEAEACRVRYVRRPFAQEPDFGATSVNYDWQTLWRMGQAPWQQNDRERRSEGG